MRRMRGGQKSTEPVAIRLTPAEREALRRAAADDGGEAPTVTAKIRAILIRWLIANGYLTRETPP